MTNTKSTRITNKSLPRMEPKTPPNAPGFSSFIIKTPLDIIENAGQAYCFLQELSSYQCLLLLLIG